MPTLSRRSLCALLAAATVAAAAPAARAAGGGGDAKKPPSNASNDYTVKASGEITYVHLKVMTFTVFAGGPPARVAVGVDLETKTGEESKIVDVLPRLQNNYVRFFRDYGDVALVGGKLQLGYLKTGLQQVTDNTVGDGIATVLIREATRL